MAAFQIASPAMQPSGEKSVRRCPTLVRHMMKDRFLLGATLVLALLTLAPMAMTRALPLTDLASHLGLVSQLNRLLSGDPMTTEHFMLQPHPAPYWLLYLMLWGATSLLGTFAGAKLVVGLSVLTIPLGLMRLAIAVGRSPRIGLWAFALCWDFNTEMGFIAFTLTTGLSFFFVARALESLRKRKLSKGWLLETVLLGFVLANSHAHAAGSAAAMIGAVALAELPNRKHFLRLFALSTVPVLSLVPWLIFAAMQKTGMERDPITDQIGIWQDAGFRLTTLYENTLDVVTGLGPRTVTGLTFLLLLLVPLLYSMGQGFKRRTRRIFAMYLSMWLLYMAFPESVFRPFYQAFIHTRHGTLILMLGLLLPAFHYRRQQFRLLLPGLVAAVGMSWAIGQQFSRFAKEAEPFFAIIDRVEAGSRVNWILWKNHTRESRLRTLTGLPAYITTEKGGYTPHLFQTPNLPVAYRHENHLDFAEWHSPAEFHAQKHSPGYDYILVQGEADTSREFWNERTRYYTDLLKLADEKGREKVREVALKALSTPRPSYRGSVLYHDPDLVVRRVMSSGDWQLYSVDDAPQRALPSSGSPAPSKRPSPSKQGSSR